MHLKIVQGLLDLILFASMTFMLLISPYTKVEESFNVQALHDIINIGLDNLDHFDHMTFPGAVKRTCIGALFIGLPSIYLSTSMKNIATVLFNISLIINQYFPTPLHTTLNVSTHYSDIQEIWYDTKMQQLIISRFLLLILNFSSFIYLRKSIKHSCWKNSKYISLWFSLLTYPLPHLLYYSSRFLPNFLCLPLTNLAIGMFIKGDITRSFTVLIFTGIIFRFEILIFTAILLFICVTGTFRNFVPILKLRESIVTVCVSSMLAIFLGSRLDSFFWNVNFTLPELDSFFFNVIEGKSSEWGVESKYSYFTNYLPKLYLSNFEIVPMLSILFLIISILHLYSIRFKKNYKNFSIDFINYGVGTITLLFWASIIYIIILSINDHKEWRFLVYVIPILCFASSNAFEYIINKLNKNSILKKILILFIFLTYISSLFYSILFSLISSWNYTGGNAAQKLNLRLINLNKNDINMLKPIVIHWDIGTCMNGGSLFTQIAENKSLGSSWNDLDDFEDLNKYWIIYDKTEDKELLNYKVDEFDYWIQYDNEEIIQFNDLNYEWILVDIIEGYSGINYDFIFKKLNNPTEFLNELIYSFVNFDFTWFKNFLHQIIKIDIRGRIWERAHKSL